jgi:hypothetical protein
MTQHTKGIEMNRNIICLMVACSAGACSVVSSEPVDEAQLETTVEGQASSKEIVIQPTPEMLAAALSGDPEAMASAVTPSGCNAPNTCPPQYGAPTGWSSSIWCAEVCGGVQCPPGEGLGGRAYLNSYRLLFDSAGNSCTQWRLTNVPFCGCF